MWRKSAASARLLAQSRSAIEFKQIISGPPDTPTRQFRIRVAGEIAGQRKRVVTACMRNLPIGGILLRVRTVWATRACRA
jgi:hypothetical protein